MVPDAEPPEESFTRFVEGNGRRLQAALVAALGPDGLDAASEALAYGWEHWGRVRGMDNPVGYLYRVGRDKGRRLRPRAIPVGRVDGSAGDPTPWVEPALAAGLRRLSERQRLAVLLAEGDGWTYAEVGRLLGVDGGTVRKHAERGLARLRRFLEVGSHV